jgi:hypothetical protein
VLVNPQCEAGLDPIWRYKDTEKLAGKNKILNGLLMKEGEGGLSELKMRL